MDLSHLHFFYGLGVFLFGMSQLESGIRKFSDARLKNWLQSRTRTSTGSIVTGAVATALLQSSSMVSLLVLAFASAGLLPLVNAIGIILGANLGTTATGWLVATLGFKLDLEAIALPLMGVSAFILATIRQSSKVAAISQIGLGLGLLLFGLSMMKISMETITLSWDVAELQGYHSFVYLLFGLLAAFLIQSSSAVMMMSLAALSVGLISLHDAVAVVIGADLGTTSTTILASLSGSQVKKKLALAQCVFNIIVDLGAYLFLLPILPAFLALVLKDSLYQLVAFHSVMNLIGLLVFAPFIKIYATWIDKFFNKNSGADKNLWDVVPPKVVEAALFALRDAVKQITLSACYNTARLVPAPVQPRSPTGNWRRSSVDNDFIQGYEALKKHEGGILQYVSKIQEQSLTPAQVDKLDILTDITRSVVYSNKTLKDIRQNLLEFHNSSIDSLEDFYQGQCSYLTLVSEKLADLINGSYAVNYVAEELDILQKDNATHYERNNAVVYSLIKKIPADRTTSSTQLNVNREIYFATESLLKAVIDLIGQCAETDVYGTELQLS